MKRNFVTKNVREKALELQAEGKKRIEIARMLGLHSSTITRILGAVQPYRDKRVR